MAAQHDAIPLGAPLHSDGHVEGRRRKHYGPLVGLGIDPPHPGNHSSLLIRARLRVAEEDVLQRVAVEDPSEENLAARVADAAVDRKSTRLNSSHVSISYAVFCLKKKT